MPDFETLCEIGLKAAQLMETGRWTIAELAADVEKEYGGKRTDEFARRINVKKRRVYEYRQVWTYYIEKCAPPHYLAANPVLTYTHMLDAMRLGDATESLAFLDEASANGWTADEAELHLLALLGKPIPGHKIISGKAYITGWAGNKVTLQIPGAENVIMSLARRKVPIEIVIRELKPELRKVMQPDKTRRIV